MIIVFILMSFGSVSQDIPKKANLIIAKNSIFDSVVNRLLDAGFYFHKKDEKFLTIKTQPKPIKPKAVTLITVYIRLKDNSAYITGTFTIEGVKDYGEMQIVNSGTNISPLKKSFNFLNEFALSLHKELLYKVTE